MLDLGSTSFVDSPEAAKAFPIPVVKRLQPVRTKDVSGKRISTEGLFTVPLGIFFSNQRSSDEEDHAFKVLKTSGDYDALIPAWYLENIRPEGPRLATYIVRIVQISVTDIAKYIPNIR